MSASKRHYCAGDATAIGNFLDRHHVSENADLNWLRPAWEFAATHPALDAHSIGRMTIWESDNEIVGFVHYEHRLGEAFFEFHPDYPDLRSEMLDVAEVNLRAAGPDGHVHLNAYVRSEDTYLVSILAARGYVHVPDLDRPLFSYRVPVSVPEPELPDGFSLQSLADNNDLNKWDTVLWRGFNHDGSPPPESTTSRAVMQTAPGYRKDLAVVVVAPDGSFASFCGMWLVPEQEYAYVEPVATVPEFRRKGLARAAIHEGIRRCANEGAQTVYVGSDLPIYRSIGFGFHNNSECWRKGFDR